MFVESMKRLLMCLHCKSYVKLKDSGMVLRRAGGV